MSAATSKLTREEFRKQKDLEAARKAGTAPAEVDEETGRDINPHIPQYISKAPWYIDTGAVSLGHQRGTVGKAQKDVTADEWALKGAKGPAASKYRKGACENCGAMTHKTKECIERPRKLGAKWTNRDIAPDEIVLSVEDGWDEKRDRWKGYDSAEHLRMVEEFELVDQERRKLKAEELERRLQEAQGDEAAEAVAEQEQDEDKYADSADMPGQKVDTKTRTTIRNLRIREDTAKYLRNLNPDSAYYDPKTRSMRDNPYKDREENPDQLQFAGDNFVRYTGDVTKMNDLQMFAWEASEKGADVHMHANPTQADLLYREYQKKKEKMKDTVKDSILETYGGAEHLQAPPKELLLAQTENYVEYSRTGRLVKGQEKAKVKSRYEEDVYINNHTSVWGSFWRDGKWGYACCHGFTKNSYCTGEAGKEAAKAATIQANGTSKRTTLVDQHLEALQSGKVAAAGKDPATSKKRKGEGDVELDKGKLSAALESEKRRRTLKAEDLETKYNSSRVDEVTEEELEAFRMARRDADDPMNSFLNGT
ncbi:pre-mRNA-splicing factor SLU7 [Hyaloraphidium curvatum]|nr:pre-mRNA-splicing factor SLU7 [Hyaloraphidium curvatum]